jgi:arylsulfatase A-like enzyme
MPYAPPPNWSRTFTHEGTRPLDPARTIIRTKRSSGLDALDLIDLYDEEITYVDSQIGRLLDGYADVADVDETLIIFTSDHGESMMEHEYWFAHGYHVYEEIARVPLMLRGPGIEPGRRRGLASGVDVTPTVLAFVGATKPPDVSGLDLLAPPMPGDARILYSESSSLKHQWRAAIRQDRKWMVSTSGAGREIEEVRAYDLRADPGELQPLAPNEDDVALHQLRDLIANDADPGGVPQHMRDGVRLTAPKVAPRATPEQLDRLRALGYAE